MEIIEFKINPTIVPAKPWEKTPKKTISIDPMIHCRVCSRLAGEALTHIESRMHSDTSQKEDNNGNSN